MRILSAAQHQQQLRKAPGARLDNLAKADLLTRISELTRHNTELAALLAAARTDNDHLREQASELQDDLAAARTSLRRMIRGETPAGLARPAAPLSAPHSQRPSRRRAMPPRALTQPAHPRPGGS